jgi:glyoxylase-like metal-dependent hydrolase (beta-lactamase superfamily II)
MQVRELARGLWYWTGRHPAWTPANGGPGGWDQEVGCYYYEGPDSVCLFDPLIPMEDHDRFFRALDRDIERAGRPVRILVTLDFHRRSAAELAERYGAPIGDVPTGVEVALSVQSALGDEQVFWIPQHRALVFGDVVLGRAHGLEVPRTWIGEEHYSEVVERLQAVLDYPVERALVTHGEPVLEDGYEALERALRG